MDAEEDSAETPPQIWEKRGLRLMFEKFFLDTKYTVTGIGNIKDCYHHLSKDTVIISLIHEYTLIIPLLLILQDLLLENSRAEFHPHM